MPRASRVKGAESTYHIIMRGNERKNIFDSEEDKTKLIDRIRKELMELIRKNSSLTLAEIAKLFG